MNDIAELRTHTELLPPPERGLPADGLEASRRAALDEFRRLARPAARRSPRGWTRRRWVALVLVPALVGVAGASYAAYALTRSAGETVNGVTCHVAADRSDFSATLASSGRSPAAVCSAAWQSGDLGVAAGTPVPDWVACAGDGDGVDVFPSNDPALCRRLGLAPLPASYEQASRRFAAMRDELESRLLRSGCTDETTARTAARQVLDGHGFDTWTIRVRGFGTPSPCAGADFDAVQHTVTLSGHVRPELTHAVQRVTETRCSSEESVLSAVRSALAAAGFGDWRVAASHHVTGRSLCVAGFDPRPEALTVVLTLYSSG